MGGELCPSGTVKWTAARGEYQGSKRKVNHAKGRVRNAEMPNEKLTFAKGMPFSYILSMAAGRNTTTTF